MSNQYQKLCSLLQAEFPTMKFLDTELAQRQYGNNSSGYSRKILGAVYPRSHEEVVRVVTLANLLNISVYPISTGHNWGYGSATPVQDHCVIVNLSLMNVIESFDNENGLVTLGPGVTLLQLWTYLTENNYHWIVPITGAGLIGSLMGNALERGFGIPPFSDHCSTIMSLKAVVADGSTYESLHESLSPNTKLGQLYKWGLGAYCDGLFNQSNFGIVTKITLALRKQPQQVGFCLLGVDEHNLCHAIDLLKYMNQEYAGNLGYIQILNRDRFISFNPKANKALISDWNMLIVMYGQRKIVRHIQKDVRARCKPFSAKTISFDETKLKMLLRLPSFLIKIIESTTKISVTDLQEIFAYYRGKPSNIGFKYFIYPERTEDLTNQMLDMEEDNKGILWFAPLIPQQYSDVISFISLVEPILKKYNIKLDISLMGFMHCFDATIPLFFNPKNESEVIKMHDCYHELLDVCIKNEYIPYRLGIQSMSALMGDSLHHDMVEKIKNALDPNNIMSPGRYHFVKK